MLWFVVRSRFTIVPSVGEDHDRPSYRDGCARFITGSAAGLFPKIPSGQECTCRDMLPLFRTDETFL